MSSSNNSIDVRGLPCPEPVIQVKRIIDGGFSEQIIIIADSKVAMENIKRLANHSNLFFTAKDAPDGDITITLSRKE